MSCNGCAKNFSMFRSEHACPSCGFGYCKSCLEHTIFVQKISKNAKVCTKCKISLQRTNSSESTPVEPPKAYFKRIEDMADKPPITVYQTGDRFERLKRGLSQEDKAIIERLEKLREDRKGSVPAMSDGQIRERLAKLRGESASTANKSTMPAADLRSNQQKCDDLLMQYLEECEMEEKRNNVDKELEERLNKLKDLPPGATNIPKTTPDEDLTEEELAARLIKRIISEPEVPDNERDSDEISSIKTSDNEELMTSESSEDNKSSSEDEGGKKKKKGKK